MNESTVTCDCKKRVIDGKNFVFYFYFLRIFFFPPLLLQFEFYAFIIDDDFGLGLIKGNDFELGFLIVFPLILG